MWISCGKTTANGNTIARKKRKKRARFRGGTRREGGSRRGNPIVTATGAVALQILAIFATLVYGDGVIYEISDDPQRLDFGVIHRYLSEESYWARNVPRELVERSAAHSLCFGVYAGAGQVGFARVVSDRATFAYLADVFILPGHRGQGLSKRLMAAVTAHPDFTRVAPLDAGDGGRARLVPAARVRGTGEAGTFHGTAGSHHLRWRYPARRGARVSLRAPSIFNPMGLVGRDDNCLRVRNSEDDQICLNAPVDLLKSARCSPNFFAVPSFFC